MIIHEKEVIFIHIPKNAGTSIETILINYDPHTYENQKDYWIKIKKLHKLKIHSGIQCIYEHLNHTSYNTYFKFSSIRNPYSRLFSLYTYIKHKTNKSLIQTVNKQDFKQYVKTIYLNNPHYLNIKHLLLKHKLNHTNFPNFLIQHQDNQAPNYHSGIPWIIPQVLLIVKDGLINQMDHVIRYETLYHDWNHIKNKLKINDDLPHINQSSTLDYRKYYDDETKKMVSKLAEVDLKIFGYGFDNFNPKLKFTKGMDFADRLK